MDRTTGANNVDIGGGKRGFRDQNKAAGLAGTEVNAAHMNAIQEEIIAVIESEGITPSDENWAQLLEAITRKLESLRVLQPIFPDVLTNEGRFVLTPTTPGTVTLAAGTEWTMRGGKKFTSVLTTIPTLPSKTYHLRWSEDDGYALKDLSNGAYNPGSVLSNETATAFDTGYDDVLIARIVTDASNVATIKVLANRANLIRQVERRDVLLSALNWTTLAGSAVDIDWARTPQVAFFAMNEWRSNNAGPDGLVTPGSAGTARAVGGRVPAAGRTRYQIPALEYYYEDNELNQGVASWQLLIQAFSGGGV